MEWCEKCKKYHESTTGGLCPGAITTLYGGQGTQPIDTLPPAGQTAGENRKDNQDLEKGGVKFDSEKAAYELVPPEAMHALADLFALGAKKYDRRNWEKGMRWGRVFAAMMRHAWKWWSGEEYDRELGQHHLASVMWCASVLFAYFCRGVGEDDRARCGIPPVRQGEERPAEVTKIQDKRRGGSEGCPPTTMNVHADTDSR